MKFLKEHILFPKRFGVYPYFWLLWITFPAMEIWPFDSIKKIVATLFLLTFLLFYRNGFLVTKYLSVWIYGQYAIAIILTITNQWQYLLLFTAWEIGSLPITQRLFYRYLIAYYLTVFLTVGSVIYLYQVNVFDLNGSSSVNFIMVLFELFSPLAAKSISNSYRRTQELRMQNSRYADLIKRGERERIARDLHDTLGQSFSTITIKAELASKLLEKKPEQVKTELNQIAEASRNNLQVVREIVTGLRQLSISEMMIELTDSFDPANIMMDSEGEETAQTWPAKVQTAIAEVLREAGTNIINYSHARNVQVSFKEESDTYIALIADNGIGIGTVRKNAHGISGMKERVSIAGGKIDIQTSTKGTTIRIALPKESVK
ncbi:sensor histidine kinase [Lentilactobacillus sunkii]|jgi:two-component system sensor histidine kinase DesK|uniref:histidine kinase n=2 Tax=Lentilactobacillus sunkii TaxID=481719 RepID=A0A0R1KYF6_9LACO|nr:histidine kinase [Lentilactobacillus sunkii]KRK88781.1 histidine kinase [Lentilactobacillus sunkii DSM 19904]OFA09350.1 sensor histidine kinase DesK [Lentilactobacillus sunkii]